MRSILIKRDTIQKKKLFYLIFPDKYPKREQSIYHHLILAGFSLNLCNIYLLYIFITQYIKNKLNTGSNMDQAFLH